MDISHVGETTIHTQDHDLKFNHILYVPQATISLVSVHRLAVDNNVFLEFHHCFFFIKDQTMRRLFLKGVSQWPLSSSSITHKISFWS
jgi:hypothetical protein